MLIFKKPSKLILRLCFLIIAKITFAQSSCVCTDISIEKRIELLRNIDSIKLFNTINELKEIKTKTCTYEGFRLEFDFYRTQLKLDKAYPLLQIMDDISNTSNCKDNFIFQGFYNKTLYFHAANDLEEFSNFAFKALHEAEQLHDEEKQILAIREIVYLFTRMNEDEKNWAYIKRVEKLIQNLTDPKLIVQYNTWLAFEYENKYTITERKTLIDSALIFGIRAKKEAFKYNMYDQIAKAYRVQEACAYHNGELKKALVFIDSAIYYGKKIKGYKNLAPFYLSKAWDHLDLGQYEEAAKWMDTALVKEKKISAAKMMMHLEAAEIYESVGKLDKAYSNFKTYSKLKDSILNLKTVEKVNELEQKYYKVTNENKIFQLEKAKQFYLFLIIGSLFTILTLILFFRQRSLKNKQKIMETEQRLNRARINPHFFFNGMASLQNLAMQEKSTKTTLYTSKLAKLMRQSLESTYKELVTVESEIDFLTQYLEIQKLRYPDKFDFEIHVSDNLEINELKLPGMLMQPFVENAIEHGFKEIDYKGKLNVNFKEKENQLNVIVEDDGKGVNGIEKEKAYKSRAMQIIKDRLFLFNKQHKSNASYQIVQTNKKGFKIVVILPKLF